MSNVIGLYATYERFTPESLDQGETAERGWWDSGNLLSDEKPPEPAFIFDPELDFDENEHPSVVDAAVAWAADRLKREGAIHPSSTQDPEWWSTESEVVDYASGETQVRSFHFHGFSDEQVEAINTILFGGEAKTLATRKVDFTLRALTAVEYTLTVDVPVDADDDDLFEIAHQLYDETDGSEYHDDGVTWDEGTHCWSEHDESNNSQSVECSILHLTFRVTPPANPSAASYQDLINEADYHVRHDLIEGSEIIEIDDKSHRVIVSARLHHAVTEEGAQDVAESLSHDFRDTGSNSVFDSELLEVEFPMWV